MPGSWIDTESLLSPRERGKNAFYVDFMCKYRARQVLAFVIEESPERAAFLSMQRERPDPDSARRMASPAIARYAAALLQAAVRRREAASQWMDVAEAAPGVFGEACLLVNGRAVVLRMSTNAAPLLDGASGLRIREGRLWHPDSRMRGALSQALLAVHLSGKATHMSFAGACGSLCQLELARAPARLRLGNESMVIIHMRAQRHPRMLSTDALCLAFDVTAAEGRVLAALAAGQKPASHALAQGVSINTVRKQIATLMEKMNCSRQADLVRKALALG